MPKRRNLLRISSAATPELPLPMQYMRLAPSKMETAFSRFSRFMSS